jgi:hypothetical protein
MISPMVPVVNAIRPVPLSRSRHSRGVTNTPMRLDADALTTAPATLPRAIEVKAIEDCTVEGSSVRYSRPVCRLGSRKRPASATAASPTSGNTR